MLISSSCGYPLELPPCGDADRYSQNMILRRIIVVVLGFYVPPTAKVIQRQTLV